MKRKTLQELTLKDNFMFAAVMLDPENCKGILERALDIRIDHVSVQYEKSLIYHPQYKGVRLDVFAKDENNTHFNVEMQVAPREIVKRSRYYHSQLDMELLLAGDEYESLPDTYVIFICDFDPFGLSKYRYTVKQSFAEDADFAYTEGNHTVYLSSMGANDDDVSIELVEFLQYVRSGVNNGDQYVEQLSASIDRIKSDRDMGARYMLLEEMMMDERKAGQAEGLAEGLTIGLLNTRKEDILKILSLKGLSSDDLTERIDMINEVSVLDSLFEAAIVSSSLEEFCNLFD